MKKFMSILMAVVILMSVFTFSVFAKDDVTQEEKQAGFAFSTVYLIIKNEYSFEEYTPEKLGSELIESVETINEFKPDNDNYSKDDWELFLEVKLKPEYRTKENIVKLHEHFKDCEYVKIFYVASLLYAIPFFPEDASQVPEFRGYYRPYVSSDNEAYIKAGGTMINNPYYKENYNGLLEHCLAIYNQFGDYIKDVDYVGYYADNCLKNDTNYVTLIFDQHVVLPEYEGARKDHILSIMEKYFNDEDILYVCDDDFAAVVAVRKEDKDILKSIEELVFIGDAFFTVRSGMLAVVGTFTLGNVEGGQTDGWDADGKPLNPHKVSAVDARLILRCAANIEKPEKDIKRFYYCADMDFDGRITAADARLALRTSAGLEKQYEITFGYTANWYDFMGPSVDWD